MKFILKVEFKDECVCGICLKSGMILIEFTTFVQSLSTGPDTLLTEWEFQVSEVSCMSFQNTMASEAPSS